MISDSTISFDRKDQVMRCSACFQAVHVSRAVLSDPDRFIDVLEHTQMDHADCKDYTDVRVAMNAHRAHSRVHSRHGVKVRDGAKSHLNGSF